MIGFYNYTVIATYMGLCAAVYGISNVIQGDLFVAIICLALAGFFDMFDGKIARTRNSTPDEKSFGIQLDSLTDLVAFGVLPAAIGYVLTDQAQWFILPMCLYVLAALIRLAYFNVSEYNRQQETTEVRKYYEGLPVTMAALIFPLTWCFKAYLGKKFVMFYVAVLVAVAILFITPFKLKKPHGKSLIGLAFMGMLVAMVLFLQNI